MSTSDHFARDQSHKRRPAIHEASSFFELIVSESVKFERCREIFKLVRRGRLDEVGIRPEGVTPAQIAGFIGGREHDYHQRFKYLLTADPSKHVMAGYIWQFKVKKYYGRQWVIIAIGEFAGTGEIIHRLLAVPDYIKRIDQVSLVEGSPH
jgi:hypothetical protein